MSCHYCNADTPVSYYPWDNTHPMESPKMILGHLPQALMGKERSRVSGGRGLCEECSKAVDSLRMVCEEIAPAVTVMLVTCPHCASSHVDGYGAGKTAWYHCRDCEGGTFRVSG